MEAIRNDIYLFVTEGCEGCKIAKNLINKAIDQSGLTIYLEVFDNSIFTSLSKLYNIDDFPTAIFIKNGMPIGKIVGTATIGEILIEINRCFK